jgi:protein-tyrosine phosphatase
MSNDINHVTNEFPCRHLAINEVDFHSHILPNCDDGSQSIDMSLRQIKYAESAQIRVICATPHFYPARESLERFLTRRKMSYSLLLKHRENRSPHIQLGAEVLMCPGLENMPGLNKLCLTGTHFFLFEMPYSHWSRGIIESVFRLNELHGIQPVMAHADRYNVSDVEQFIRVGIPLQLNIEHIFSPVRGQKLRRWIRDGHVIAVGSDIHRLKNVYRSWEKLDRFKGYP